MILMQGKGVSPGVVSGPIYFFRRQDSAIDSRRAEPDAEKQRLAAAQKTAAEQLHMLAERCRKQADNESAQLFDTHALLVEDEDFVCLIHSLLDQQKCSAESAVQQAGGQFASAFSNLDDAYMQARSADIRDISHRLIAILTGASENAINSDHPVILAAEDLAPSETIQLDRQKILALLTQQGSSNSHTAILARSLGIPAVCSLGSSLNPDYSGRVAYVDGQTGDVILDPDEAAMESYQKKLRIQQEQQTMLSGLVNQEDITPDGRRIDLCCNIGSAEEIDAVLAAGGRGIGLFRSEFLFLAADDYPSEEEQFIAYRAAAASMNGKRVVIRTLDIGADKQAAYFEMPKEENPALGVRGIRLCLNRAELFRPQLRAIYRASAFGQVAILFPMITSVWEIRECRRLCRSVMTELDSEGIPYNKNTEIGVMIETPASVLIADELAEEADFFSVGTNDLTQYMLACDRQSNALHRFFDPHHPALLRALKMITDSAHAAGIWVGICGDLGADHDMLPLLLSIGIDEISVPPAAVLPLRAQIRKTPASSCLPESGKL